MRALAHAMDEDPDLARAFHESIVTPELEGLQHMLGRAVERGELDSDRPAQTFLPHMMLGALVTRPLIEHKRADRAYLRRYVDAVVLPALGLSD